MAKTILKELIIALLLCLAIILVLGILFYEYVPMSKTIPNPVAYVANDEVKKELSSSECIDEDNVIMTYEVDSTDLNNYKRIQDYKQGKANPFSSYAQTQEENESENENSTADKSQNGTNASTNSTSAGNKQSENEIENTNENSVSSSGGKYFQDKGTK